MTYDAMERSNYEGRPVNLYQFAIDGAAWRFTDAQHKVTSGGVEYESGPCSDSGIVLAAGGEADDLTITVPATTSFTGLYSGTPPSSPVMVTIRRMHLHDEQPVVVWSGVIKSVRRATLLALDVVCRPLTADLSRPGLRLSWGRGCPYALYDRNCRVNRAAFAVTVQLQSVGDFFVTAPVAAMGNGHFAGGIIEFPHPSGYTESRAIDAHNTTRLGLMTPADGMSAGMWVTLYPGCDRTSPTCELKFNNLPNYGGFRHLPTKSPFDGDPVF